MRELFEKFMTERKAVQEIKIVRSQVYRTIFDIGLIAGIPFNGMIESLTQFNHEVEKFIPPAKVAIPIEKEYWTPHGAGQYGKLNLMIRRREYESNYNYNNFLADNAWYCKIGKDSGSTREGISSVHKASRGFSFFGNRSREHGKYS